MPRIRQLSSRCTALHVALAGVLLCGCADNDPLENTDAGLPEGKFTLTITRPRVDERFDVFWDEALFLGTSLEPGSLSFEFDERLDKERTMAVSVVLRETGLLLDRLAVRSNCLLDLGFWGPLWREDVRIGAAANGNIRNGGSTCTNRSGGGGVTENGEPLCLTYLDSCPAGRCAFRKVSVEPELLQYTCTGPGTIPAGEACAFGEPSLENFDDCEAGTGCIDGICRRLCYAEYSITKCDGAPEVPCVRIAEFGEARMGYCADT